MRKLQRHIDWFVQLPADEFVLLRRAWFRLLRIWLGQKLNKNKGNNASSFAALAQTHRGFKAVRLAVIRAEKYHFIQASEYIQRLTIQSLLSD